jgi:hypothetical protein
MASSGWLRNATIGRFTTIRAPARYPGQGFREAQGQDSNPCATFVAAGCQDQRLQPFDHPSRVRLLPLTSAVGSEMTARRSLRPGMTKKPKLRSSSGFRPFFGRAGEVGLLAELMRPAGPRVIHVHGICGIGKSALISEFAAIWRRRKRTVLLLDGRTIEPTENGFQHDLSRQLR